MIHGFGGIGYGTTIGGWRVLDGWFPQSPRVHQHLSRNPSSSRLLCLFVAQKKFPQNHFAIAPFIASPCASLRPKIRLPTASTSTPKSRGSNRKSADPVYRPGMLASGHFGELILGTIIGLLPIINPFAAAPVFLAITEGDSDARRRQQAKMGCFYMLLILVGFLVGGSFIMRFFGISVPGIRIAGGIMVAGIGFSMLKTAQTSPQSEEEHEEARAKRDISFTPLAMPQLSGPGSIAVTVGFSSLATHWVDYVAIILGIFVVAAISYITLILSASIVRVIGVNAMNAMTKIMGFLLLCVGVQFLVNGVVAIASDPAFLRSIHDAWVTSTQ